MREVFTFSRQGRTLRTFAVVIAIYTALLAAIVLIDAVWWLMALLALVTLPALSDLWRDPSTGIRLSDSKLNWQSGRRSGSLDLAEISHMRFDTRWDLSIRVTAVLQDNTRVRLPYESLPAHREFEAALRARGVRVERHHFSVF